MTPTLLQLVTAATWEQQFRVDAMAAALMIAEFRVTSYRPRRRLGVLSGSRSLLCEEVSYGAAKAAQVMAELTCLDICVGG